MRFTSDLDKTTFSGVMVGRWLKRKWKQSKWRWQMQTTLLRSLLQRRNKKQGDNWKRHSVKERKGILFV